MSSLQEQIKAAEQAAAEAEARVSDPRFIEEEEQRKKLSEAKARTRAAQDRVRSAELARRLDAVAERLGQSAKIEGVLIAELPDAFVVRAAGGKAYGAWQQGVRDAAAGAMRKGTREKVNTDEVNRVYVVAGIEDWNGQSPDESETGAKLHAYLRENPAVVTELQQVIQRLDGAESEARKR